MHYVTMIYNKNKLIFNPEKTNEDVNTKSQLKEHAITHFKNIFSIANKLGTTMFFLKR